MNGEVGKHSVSICERAGVYRITRLLLREVAAFVLEVA
jgi:hypothetical protein